MAGAKQLAEALKNLKQPVTSDRLTAAIMQFCISKDALPASIQEFLREAIQLGWIRKTTCGFYVIGRDGQKNTEKEPKVAQPIDALTPPGESLRMKGAPVPNWRKYTRNVVIKSKKRHTEETMTPNIVADARLDNEDACASSQSTSAIHKTYTELVMEEMFSDARLDDEGAGASSQDTSAIHKTYAELVMEEMFSDARIDDEVAGASCRGTSAIHKTYAELVMEEMFLDARLDDEVAPASSQGMTAIHKTYAELVMEEMLMGPKNPSKDKAQGRKEARPNLPKEQCIRKKPSGTKAVKQLMVMDAHQSDEVMPASSQGTSTNDMTYAELVMEAMFLTKLSAENAMDAHPGAEDRDSIPSSCESSTENIPDNVPVAAHPMNTLFQGPEDTTKGGQEVLPKSQKTQAIRKKPCGKKAVEPLMIMDAHLGDLASEGTTSDDISYTDLVIQGMVWQKLRHENAVDVHLNDEGASVSAQSTASIDVQIANPCVSPTSTIPIDVPVAAQPMDEVFTGPRGTAQVNSQDEQKTPQQPPKKQDRHDVRKNKAKKKSCAKKAVKSRKIRNAHSDGLEQPNNSNFPFVNQFMGLLRALSFMGPKENAQGTSQRNAKHGKAAQKKNTKGPQRKKR